MPEGITADLLITDNIPAGLSVTAQQVITESASSLLLSADFNGTLPAPTITAAGGDGVDASWDFGDTTTTADNDSDNNSFVIEVTAVVLDVIGNQDGGSRTNTATLSYTRNGSTSTRNDSAAVSFIEPVLTIDKSLAGPLPIPLDAGTVITYQIVLQHDTNSHYDAFDIVITDTLPVEFINSSLLGITVDGITDPGGDLTAGLLRIPAAGTFDLPQGAVITATFEAELSSSANPSQSIANTAGAVWTSLDGAPAEERTGGGTEPDGADLHNGGAVDDYEVASTETISVDDPDISKGLTATSAAHTSGSNVTIGEQVTYTITVTLPEGSASSLQVIDQIPAGMAYVGGSYSIDRTGFNGTLPAETLYSYSWCRWCRRHLGFRGHNRDQ